MDNTWGISIIVKGISVRLNTHMGEIYHIQITNIYTQRSVCIIFHVFDINVFNAAK